MAKYRVETEKGVYEVETEESVQEQPQTTQPPIERQNILGQLMNVPAAAMRSGLQGTGYAQGAMQPSQVPTFQNLVAEKYPIHSQNVVQGIADVATKMPMMVGGQLADIATNPAEMLMNLIGMKSSVQQGIGKAANKAKQLTKIESDLNQARNAKVALDKVRTTLGQAKQLAMEEVKDLPVEFDWKKIPEKVLSKLREPANGYGVEFTQDGQIVNTMGNLDKVKMALQDMPSTKDFVEAGNMAKRQIITLSGEVRDAMVSTANKADKPQLANSLKDYHDFMNRYNIINDHLVDKYGNALANKLRHSFIWRAEPLLRESWKDVAKNSPEIKSVMKSQEARRLLKNLLGAGGAGTAEELTFGLGKKLIRK